MLNCNYFYPYEKHYCFPLYSSLLPTHAMPINWAKRRERAGRRKASRNERRQMRDVLDEKLRASRSRVAELERESCAAQLVYEQKNRIAAKARSNYGVAAIRDEVERQIFIGLMNKHLSVGPVGEKGTDAHFAHKLFTELTKEYGLITKPLYASCSEACDACNIIDDELEDERNLMKQLYLKLRQLVEVLRNYCAIIYS